MIREIRFADGSKLFPTKWERFKMFINRIIKWLKLKGN